MTEKIAVPSHIAPYVSVLGEEDAVAFLLEFGGSAINLPASPQGRGEVEGQVGARRTAELAQLLGPMVRVPTAKPWLARKLKKNGLPVGKIARKLHVSDVTVRSYLSPADRRQFPLL